MQFNDVYFAGNVGRDAEVRFSQNQKEVVLFSVCYSRKGKDGAPDESTWLNIVASGWLADIARDIKKGDNVVVQGSLKINQYEKDGQKRTGVSLIARSVGIVAKRGIKPETAPVADSDPFGDGWL